MVFSSTAVQEMSLQELLDAELQALEASAEDEMIVDRLEVAVDHSVATGTFAMTGLFGLIPDTDTSPISISFRSDE
jgi:hypothetical protein